MVDGDTEGIEMVLVLGIFWFSLSPSFYSITEIIIDVDAVNCQLKN